ncbi:MAG: hypothetical protein HWN67_18820 [Candidatus Helarchaeota archaeon]|nr:hypothetical protein [Candidatus Helarchaeota archaeon]
MVNYRFRLLGVPPDQAVKTGDIDVNQNVAEIKKIIRNVYKLNPIVTIQFIHKGKVLPNNVRFASLGIIPKKDVITVMASQVGGKN